MILKQVQNLGNNERKVVGKYLTPFQRKLLEKSQQRELTDKQHQRIKIMLLADEGLTQAQICSQLGCGQATARHWISQAKNNQAHNWNSTRVGRPTSVSDEYLERLRFLVNKSPQEVNVPNRNYQYPFKRWTAKKLCQHLEGELGIKVTPQHLNRLLKQMGLSTKSKPAARVPSNSDRSIQIADLDLIAISDATEIWNFNPLMSV